MTNHRNEAPAIRDRRLISRLHIAAIAIDEMITEAMGDDAERLDEVLLLRSAIAEVERYQPEQQELAERIISKHLS